MMGVYIKGMEMPSSCHECVAGYGGCCYVAPAESDGICPDQSRADFCPLIPVPDHGRLIDADALYEEMFKGYLDIKEHDGISAAMTYACGMHDVKHAPTIIEAENAPQNSQNCGEKSEGEA